MQVARNNMHVETTFVNQKILVLVVISLLNNNSSRSTIWLAAYTGPIATSYMYTLQSKNQGKAGWNVKGLFPV